MLIHRDDPSLRTELIHILRRVLKSTRRPLSSGCKAETDRSVAGP